MSGTRHKRERRRLTVRKADEVGYFALKHGISRAQAEMIIGRARGNRPLANALCTPIKKQVLPA